LLKFLLKSYLKGLGVQKHLHTLL